MLATLLLAFAAGFFGGNGLPYYTAGSTGEGASPSPFRASAAGNVLNGVALLAIGVVCWHFAHVGDHPAAGWAAFAAGVTLVGLVHARMWRRDPWRRDSR